MSRTDRRNGPYGDAAIRLPCRVASTVPITASGLQTVNGVVLTENDRVLRTAEIDTTQNGIFIAATSTWQRPVDFDGVLDGVPGTLVVTLEGALHSNTIWETICADNPIVFGTSAITFQVKASGTNTGDITIAGQNYLSLVNQVLTAAKIALANMADLAANSFIGNNTGIAGVPLALNQAQATALLNAFVGDSGSGGTKGKVPAPAAGDTAADKFLKADGTWETPPEATQATESLAGIAELATQAETDAGTDDLKIITPLKLATHLNYYMIARDEKANNTPGGAPTAGARNVRTINTVVVNSINGASLSLNQMILPAGTYYIIARAAAGAVAGHKLFFRNVTDSSDTIVGSSDYVDTTFAVSYFSYAQGIITIGSQKTFQLEHYISTNASGTSGLGYPANSGAVEVYTEVYIYKFK